MRYKSLHHYLDIHLGENPTGTDIKECKSKYWKWYRKEHRKNRVTQAKALNLTLPTLVWKNLKQQAHDSGIDVYDYIKQKLSTTAEASVEMNVRFTYELMQCYQLLQECAEGEANIAQVIEYVERIIMKT